MKNKKVTLSDIADKLNLSIPTVSNILKNRGAYDKFTQELVWNTAKELQYKHFRSIESKIKIALLLSDMKEDFFRDFYIEMEFLAHENNFEIYIYDSENDAIKEDVNLDVIRKDNFDVLIISPIKRNLSFEHIRSDVILLDRDIEDSLYPFFGIDNKKVCYTLCNKLHEEFSIDNLAFFSYQQDDFIHNNRFLGYKKFIEEKKKDIMSLELKGTNKNMDQQINDFLDMHSDCYAFICSSNLLLYKLLIELKKRNRYKKSIVGTFDENKWFVLFERDLIYIKQPTKEMASLITNEILSINQSENQSSNLAKTKNSYLFQVEYITVRLIQDYP